MSISRRSVEHISQLARIEVNEAEKEKLAKELSAILEFVEKLNRVDTENIEPMTGGTTLENVMRPDEQMDVSLEGKAAVLMEAVPEVKDGYVKVKAVFEQ